MPLMLLPGMWCKHRTMCHAAFCTVRAYETAWEVIHYLPWKHVKSTITHMFSYKKAMCFRYATLVVFATQHWKFPEVSMSRRLSSSHGPRLRSTPTWKRQPCLWPGGWNIDLGGGRGQRVLALTAHAAASTADVKGAGQYAQTQLRPSVGTVNGVIAVPFRSHLIQLT